MAANRNNGTKSTSPPFIDELEESQPSTSQSHSRPFGGIATNVFRRQKNPTGQAKQRLSSARPWTTTRSRHFGADSVTTPPNGGIEEAGGSHPIKGISYIHDIEEGDSPSLSAADDVSEWSAEVQDLDALDPSISDLTMDLSDVEDIELDEVPPTSTQFIFPRPLSGAKKGIQKALNMDATRQNTIAFKSTRFRRFKPHKARRIATQPSLPERSSPPIHGPAISPTLSIVSAHFAQEYEVPSSPSYLKVSRQEEARLDRAFSPGLDVDLAPQIVDDKHSSANDTKSQLEVPEVIVLKGNVKHPCELITEPQTPAPDSSSLAPPTQNTLLDAVPNGTRSTDSLHTHQGGAHLENGAVAGTIIPTLQDAQPNSLIKSLTKKFARFRRNRVTDANSDHTDFFNKHSMLQHGGESAPGAKADGKGPVHDRMVFDSGENYFYYWIAVVSTAYVYNLLVVIARSVFSDLAAGHLWILWLGLDLTADFIYLLDMVVRTRTGFLEQGILIRDVKKIRSLYTKNRQFKIDVASLLPLDYLLSVFFLKRPPALRFNRLLRKERIQKFMEQTETRSSLPNAFRVGVVVWYIAVIIHWNACLYFMISESIGLGSDAWVYGELNRQSLPEGVNDTLTRRYIYSFYWSTLILTTIGEVPGPQKNIEFAFVTLDLMCGVLIFATILETRVIKWFDYLWANKQNLTDQQVLKVLPDKLQAEIAMHVHFETLRKVRIFQDCEAGLLAELVLKLQLQVFSPMDYVCRKGDIGREMYIVKRGMLQVVADDGCKVFATLSEGAVFGELSILNIAEYPDARKILIQKGRELLRKDNLLDESAPEENKTAEEISDELQSSIRILQTRIARLTGEHTNTERKLQERIRYLEAKLRKYGAMLDRESSEDEDVFHDDDHHVEAERKKLL
ncbi:cyclic nucleotide-binding domain-containing protein [Ditylenchus destructor]|nr:cyclic nucleotide-binding domain-containing protein [Ditylenchus destructor]